MRPPVYGETTTLWRYRHVKCLFKTHHGRSLYRELLMCPWLRDENRAHFSVCVCLDAGWKEPRIIKAHINWPLNTYFFFFFYNSKCSFFNIKIVFFRKRLSTFSVFLTLHDRNHYRDKKTTTTTTTTTSKLQMIIDAHQVTI